MTSVEYCEGLVREADKDRFLATLFAPAEFRADLHAIYAFDLETAAVRQRVRDEAAGEIRLQWWEEALTGESGGAGHPVVAALRSTIARRNIDMALPLVVIDARRRGLYAAAIQTEAERELFAVESAGSIFRMAAVALGGAADDATRLACSYAGVAALAEYPETASSYRNAVKALIRRLPPSVLPALLPLTLRIEGRAALPQWRKQWILWRASKNLGDWL